MSEIDYESLPENAAFAAQLAAGALAGITEHVVMHPFDSIKTRMQILNPNPQAIYNSMSQAFTRISSTEGFKALWRGVGSVTLGAGPAHALYFGTYEKAKLILSPDGKSITGIAASGACATIVSDAFMNPFDVVKQRMQVHGSNYPNFISCAKHVFQHEGLRAFYLSYPTVLTMSIPFHAITFTTYETASNFLNPTHRYSPVAHVIAGGLAGATAAAVTTPLDVCKTLLQTRGTSQDGEIRKTSGLVQAAKLIYRREGMAGFARGLTPRILSHMPSTALCWSAYEYFKWFLLATEKVSI